MASPCVVDDSQGIQIQLGALSVEVQSPPAVVAEGAVPDCGVRTDSECWAGFDAGDLAVVHADG